MLKKKLVVLTGAGISAESGLKTFRDGDGLWENYNVYDVATPRAFKANPALVLTFYNLRRKDVAAALPNDGHKGLAALEQYFDVYIITQNIDDLHERGGSSKVIHLHGEIFKMRSEKNEHKIYEITGEINVGDLAEDGGQLRPHIVWFDEQVPLMTDAVEVISTADIFAVVGTSLLVYPAAGLINYAPRSIPKYIIDTKIPYTGAVHNLTAIEQPASKGVAKLNELLKPFR